MVVTRKDRDFLWLSFLRAPPSCGTGHQEAFVSSKGDPFKFTVTGRGSISMQAYSWLPKSREMPPETSWSLTVIIKYDTKKERPGHQNRLVYMCIYIHIYTHSHIYIHIHVQIGQRTMIHTPELWALLGPFPPQKWPFRVRLGEGVCKHGPTSLTLLVFMRKIIFIMGNHFGPPTIHGTSLIDVLYV